MVSRELGLDRVPTHCWSFSFGKRGVGMEINFVVFFKPFNCFL